MRELPNSGANSIIPAIRKNARTKVETKIGNSNDDMLKSARAFPTFWKRPPTTRRETRTPRT
jgi:hypothetical protein